MTNTNHKMLRVANGDPGEDCPACGVHGGIYTIERGSGYVVACRRHARDLLNEAVESGDIYQTEAA